MTKKRDYILSDTTYRVLHFVAILLLPGLGTLYFVLAQIWGLPAAEQVVGSIVAVDTFLGGLLKIGSNSYDKSTSKYDGALEVSRDETNQLVYTLNLEEPPEKLRDKETVRFQVQVHPLAK